MFCERVFTNEIDVQEACNLQALIGKDEIENVCKDSVFFVKGD